MSELVGLANNTKWSELQKEMSLLGPLAPYWRTLATNGYQYPPEGWDGDWAYHFRLGGYEGIEVCELSPRLQIDAVSFEQCKDICQKIGFELELCPNENIIKIIGYRRV